LYDSEKKNKDNKKKFILFKKRDALVSNFVSDMIKSK